MGWSRSSLPFNFLPFLFPFSLFLSACYNQRQLSGNAIWEMLHCILNEFECGCGCECNRWFRTRTEPKDNYAHKGANQPRPTQIKNTTNGEEEWNQKKVQQQGQGQGQGQELGKSSVRILERRSWIRDQDYATDFSGIQEKQHHDIMILRKIKK